MAKDSSGNTHKQVVVSTSKGSSTVVVDLVVVDGQVVPDTTQITVKQ